MIKITYSDYCRMENELYDEVKKRETHLKVIIRSVDPDMITAQRANHPANIDDKS